jgi:hypothetical protein
MPRNNPEIDIHLTQLKIKVLKKMIGAFSL